MTTWSTRSKALLNDASRLLLGFDIELQWSVGTQGITKFHTRTVGSTNWAEWDGEMGEPDLAFLVAMILDLPHG